MSDRRAQLRRLPSVDALLSRQPMPDLIRQHSRELVVSALRRRLDRARQEILSGGGAAIDERGLIADVSDQLERESQPSLRPVINATGVIIHTNLGRALLSQAARDAMLAAAGAYNTLEYDLATGRRGSRLTHAGPLLRDVTGAEDALVVNNNASALILILSALAGGREVVISRGQLVEIGGGFRMSEIMLQSGARLVEVGATNRTRLADFSAAIGDETAMLLRVHASNFKQIGFVEQPALADLTALAHERGVLAVDDLGSGALLDTTPFGLDAEPTVQDSVGAGFDLTCFSGDKLVGGPQAGIIIGKADLVARLKRHPLARALRADKLTYAALMATLDCYRRGRAVERVPVWQMIAMPLGEIEARAKRWADATGGTVVRSQSTVGGGSLPGASLPTCLLALDHDAPDAFTAELRRSDPPVIARIAAGRALLDPRTVLPEQDEALLGILRSLL